MRVFDLGVASVREKRLALEGEARGDTPPTPEEDKVRIDPDKQAKEVSKSMFATSNYEYGSRGSLELFGVAQVSVYRPICNDMFATPKYEYASCSSLERFCGAGSL
jgi:hypothetical protein